MQSIEICRCGWAKPTNPIYIKYHDEEWGVPVHDDQRWFEFLLLETFQAGISWEIVLNKRENFRAAFAGFAPNIVATFGQGNVESLMEDKGIIRNRAKINAAVDNAKAFLSIQEKHGSFDAYIWKFTDGRTIVNQWEALRQVPASTPQSDAMSKELKKLGFKFTGTTVCYAHMQATGMVNDHLTGCFRYHQVPIKK